MGTSCKVCRIDLATKVREYCPLAQNRAVTVTIIENPLRALNWAEEDAARSSIYSSPRLVPSTTKCDYCDATAVFELSYHPRKV